MIYEFGETLRAVSAAEIRPDRLTAGILPLGELKKQNGVLAFGESALEACEKPDARFRSTIEVTDDSLFSILSLRSIRDVFGARDRVGMFVKKNLLLLVSAVDEDNSIEAAFEDAVRRLNPASASLERIICMFFDRLYWQDGGYLEELENKIGRLEVQIQKGSAGKNFNSEILTFRRRLLVMRNYYEQFIDLGEAMLENEGDLFCEDRLHYFRNMVNKVSRLANNVQLLRDSLVQLREAYQASLDFAANQIMKVFTVVTSIFLPLTLIAGWYGMNFTYMPELHWRYGYLAVFLLSAAIVALGVWFLKRKKYL